MVSATLTKWGNSQGVLIPKSLCDKYGLSVGDKLIIEEGAAGIELKPQRRRFATHPVDLDELFEGWTGTYEPPEDWPCVGDEIDWANRVARRYGDDLRARRYHRGRLRAVGRA